MFRKGVLVIISTMLSMIATADAQVGQLIRDTELENSIRAYTAPLLEAVGLDGTSVQVHIINHSDVNAFVSGGKNIFIFTGLLQSSQTPNQLIGVLAHEIGHIRAGHLARTQEALRKATTQRVVAMLLGTAAVVAGQGKASAAIISSGRHVSLRGFLQYSRNQESAADQAAFKILEETEQSAKGFVEFLKILKSQESLLSASTNPYLRSHPLTLQRISAAKRHLTASDFTDVSDSFELQMVHDRMKAKLMGYLQPKRALNHYREEDPALAAKYARTIANFQIGNYDLALDGIDKLIFNYPADSYFHELRGDILFEYQYLSKSIHAYKKSLDNAPNAPLVMASLAKVQLALGTPTGAKEAISILERAIHLDASDATSWRLLSIAYGRTNDIGLASLASAEENYLLERYETAEISAKRAQKFLMEGSPSSLRTQDILDAIAHATPSEQR